jgi:hypothetical protein
LLSNVDSEFFVAALGVNHFIVDFQAKPFEALVTVR